MKHYTYCANEILVSEDGRSRVLYRADASIGVLIPLKDGLVFQKEWLKDTEPRNIYMIDYEGRLRWQIPRAFSCVPSSRIPEWAPEEDAYVYLKLQGDSLITITYFGNVYEINPADGSLKFLEWRK